jgi:hypothetical protein
MNERKPTPEELFEALDGEDDDIEAARILALSDEALDGELAKAGFDPATERARGRKLGERALGGATSQGTGQPPRRFASARWITLLAASLGALAVGGIGIGSGLFGPTDDHVGASAPRPGWTGEPASQKARRVALQACDAERWAECIDGLDAARKLDPAGDADESVQRARAAAAEHLAK